MHRRNVFRAFPMAQIVCSAGSNRSICGRPVRVPLLHCPKDLEVEVFPSWLDSIDHDPSISLRNRHAMNCPTLDRYFSNAVHGQFDLFPLLIQKLTRGPHGDDIHRVMFWLVRNHYRLTSGWVLRGSDAATKKIKNCSKQKNCSATKKKLFRNKKNYFTFYDDLTVSHTCNF